MANFFKSLIHGAGKFIGSAADAVGSALLAPVKVIGGALGLYDKPAQQAALPTPAPTPAMSAPKPVAPTEGITPAAPPPVPTDADATKLAAAAVADERKQRGRRTTLFTDGGYLGEDGSSEASGETKQKRSRTLLA